MGFDPHRHCVVAVDKDTGGDGQRVPWDEIARVAGLIAQASPGVVYDDTVIRSLLGRIEKESVAALVAMAERMREADARAADLEARLAQVEAPLRALAEEAAKRIKGEAA